MPVSMGAIFPFAASRILFNAEDTGRGGGGEGEGEGDARFPPTWFLFPLGRGQARYPPEEKRRQGGWTHSRFDANRHNLSLSSPLLFVLSKNRRLHAPLRFPVIGFLELERRGEEDGYITLLQSLECFLVMKRPMFRARGEGRERERESRAILVEKLKEE